jgi:uncharacterized membrane protein
MILAALQFEAVERSWLWIGAAVAAIILTFVIYRGIYMRTERRFTWVLMALRAAGLLALLLALAKPTWTTHDELVDAGRVAIIVDDSLSMSLDSRYAKARAAVARLREDLEAKHGQQQVEVDVFDIAGERIENALPEQPRTERTDLVRSVSSAIAQLRSKLLVGVIVISDGVDNTGRQDISELADGAAPIYCVGFAPTDDAGAFDLELVDVKAIDRVMVNNSIQVAVTVAKHAGPQIEATITIKRGTDTPVAQQTITLPEGDSKQQLRLTFAPAEAGSFVYTATVQSEAGEKRLANNARHFPLQVDGDAIGVLYLEGFLRYEYKYLRRRLENDPDLHLISVVRRANPKRPGATVGKLAITPEVLRNIDLVILGDMEANYLAPREYEALVNWVNGSLAAADTDAGSEANNDNAHSLLVLGGYQSFGPEGFRATKLADILPVVFSPNQAQAEDPFILELTDAGSRSPIFQITGDRVKNLSMWRTSPHLLGSNLIQRAKAGAEVLAVNPNIQIGNTPAPVIVTGRYGSGQVMVIAADTTWRWTRLTRVVGTSDTLYSRFWSQTVRWLTGRELNDERSAISVSTDRPDYEVGREVAIRVVRQASADTSTPGDITVQVIDETGTATPIQTHTSSAEPDVSLGSFYPSAGSRYEVHAALADETGPVANRTAEFIVYGSELELADTGTNEALLQTIAQRSGGVYVDINDIDQLSNSIERKERRYSRVQRKEFWNSPILFLFFLAAVTVEWILRRKNHLA